MAIAEQLEIEFYKNGSAENVLKRFVFSQNEEKLIRDAIRTANLATPRMKLIRDADELLKEVAKTREPIAPTEKTEVSAEAMVQFEKIKFKQSQPKAKRQSIPFFYFPKTNLGRMIWVGIIIILLSLQYYTASNTRNKQDTVMQRNSKSIQNYKMSY